MFFFFVLFLLYFISFNVIFNSYVISYSMFFVMIENNKIKKKYCAAVTLFWFMSHLYTRAIRHTRICTRTYTHTHTHTHTHRFDFAIFGKIAQLNIQAIKTILVRKIHAKFKFFNENMRSTRDWGQIKRNKLKYQHYLNTMIEKCMVRKFILVKFHASSLQLYYTF